MAGRHALEQAAATGGTNLDGTKNKAFIHTEISIPSNFTILEGHNALTVGPVTIESDVTITVPSGSVWTIV